MRFFIFVCLALVAAAIGYSGLLKRKFVLMMPVSVFTSILILYIFGLMGHLKLGVIVYIAVAGILFLAGLTKSLVRREMKLFSSNVLTFGFVFFLVMLLFIFYMTEGRLLSRFDEFTHWGLTVKNYMVFDGFANIPGSTTHGAGYQPGISLFCYLFTSLRDQINECDMLKAMNVYLVSMMLPIFRRITWKRFIYGIFLIPVVLFMPWLFATAIIPYNTLLVDAAMAVTFGSLLYFYYSSAQSKVLYFVMGLGSATMILIRPGSELFALMILGMVVVDVLFFRRREFAVACSKGGWIMPLFYVAISAVTYLSWRIFTAANNMKQVFDYVDPSGGNISTADSIKTSFFSALTTVPDNATIKVSYLVWIIIFAVLAVLLVLLTKGGREQWRTIIYSALTIFGLICYAAGLLYMYLHLFSEYEGNTLASMERYMAIFLLGALMFFVYMLVEKIFARFGGFGNILILVPVVLILVFTPWNRVVSDMFVCSETIEKTIAERANYYQFEEAMKNLDYEKDRVYFIAQNTNGKEYQTSYYLATPVSLSYDYEMGWSLGYPYSDEDVWTLDMSSAEWEQALIDGGYTYVYLYQVDKQFRSVYGDLFQYKSSISNNTAYRVKVQNNRVTLERAF